MGGSPHQLRGAPRSALLIAIVAAILLPGCAARRAPVKEPDLRPVVTRVRVAGAKTVKPALIRGRLAQRQTHPLHWIPVLNFIYPAIRLDGTSWEDDGTRISNIYALNGFFDAKLGGSSVIIRKLRKDGTPRFVWIQHNVEEGEASRIRNVHVVVHADPDGEVSSPVETEALRQELASAVALKTDSRFTMAAANQTRDRIAGRLAARGFARAKVTSTIDAYPEELVVDIRYDVRPGRHAVFGAVRIHGLKDVRERYVLRHVRLKEGESWDSRKVSATQQEIYNMGVFSLVTVGPDDSADVTLLEDGTEVVPIDIFLKERKPRTLEGGPGIGFSLGSVDVHGRVTLGHVNAFKRLVRFELDTQFGFVWLGNKKDLGPTGFINLDIKWPDFPVRTLTTYVKGGLETDVRKGYKFLTPEGEGGLVWNPARPFRLTVSYSVSYFYIYENRLDELEDGEGDEITFTDGYFLTKLRQEAVLDLRDNLFAPNRGVFASVAVDEALPPGTFRYIKVVGDLRGYIPVVPKRFVVAIRGTGSYIAVLGGDDIPINEKIFAGGDGSVRGWKSRYLGPRTVEENCLRNDCIIPLGGLVGFTGSLELRGKPLDMGSFGLWVAGFTDFGRVWATTDGLGVASKFFEDLQFSVGVGIRAELAIGRIRVDFAIHPRPWTDDVFRETTRRPNRCGELTLQECEDSREAQNWNIHFSIGESF